MKSIEINTFFGEKQAHIEISAPMGAANVYHVMINKYFEGQIVKTSSNGWQIYLYPKTMLQGDDVSVILGLIDDEHF